MPDIPRCVVVGAGLLGLSAARSLARRGWSVEVVEAAHHVGHAFAGSKGGARIFRLGYPEPHYVEMALAARELWRALERERGRRLLMVTGQLTFGDEDALASIDAALLGHGVRRDWLTPEAARARYRGITTAGPALFEPDSGVLAADECLQALRATAAFDVCADARVTALHQADDGVRIDTEGRGELRADVVVACAGPGTMGLLGPAAPDVRVAAPSLPQVAYFGYAAEQADPVARPVPVPVFIEWGDDMIYGLPVPRPGRAGAPLTVKVSHHTPGPSLERYDPTATTPPSDHPALLARLVAAVQRLLPGVDPDPVATERCVYDNSTDTDFILDRVGNIVVGCGTSGHGFKFGPLLGEVLADLAEGTRPSIDLAPFAFERG